MAPSRSARSNGPEDRALRQVPIVAAPETLSPLSGAGGGAGENERREKGAMRDSRAGRRGEKGDLRGALGNVRYRGKRKGKSV